MPQFYLKVYYKWYESRFKAVVLCGVDESSWDGPTNYGDGIFYLSSYEL